jgi:hypothetical protein
MTGMRDDRDDVADYGRHEDKNGNEADDKTTSGGMIKTGTGYRPNTSTNGLIIIILFVCLSVWIVHTRCEGYFFSLFL